MPKEIRIIIDTSWWISLIVSKQSIGLPSLLRNEKYRICFSKELKEEVFKALTYTRNAKRMNELNFKLFSDFINDVAWYFDITSSVSVCRDEKDNFLLALSRDANADYLITNDDDLLHIKQFKQTIICTLPDFLKNYFNKSDNHDLS
ncbi:MAG: putative toxin-antitoxin system toxin component, PIN family [Ginsengibacter sp.]